MKKLLVILCCLITLGLTAQGKSHKRGAKIEALKIAFITEAIGLSPAQAEKFWPRYNESQNKHKEKRKKIRQLSQLDDEDLTEQEAKSRLEELLALEEQLLEIHKEEFKSLSAVISNKQLIALIGAKERFKREIVDGLQRRRRNKQ